MPTLLHRVPGRLIVAGFLLTILFGCDTETARTSVYQRFVGSWSVERITVDATDETSRIRARYDTLRFVFAPADDTRNRSLRLQASPAGEPIRLDGPVQLQAGDALVWNGGLSQATYWTYQFETSRRVTLRSFGTETDGARELLQTLLPGRAWGERPDTVFRLRRL